MGDRLCARPVPRLGRLSPACMPLSLPRQFGKWLAPLAFIFTAVMFFVPDNVTLGEMVGQPVRPEPGFSAESYPQLARAHALVKAREKAAAGDKR